MYSALQRPSSWSNACHICLSCQRRLLLSQGQTRNNTTTTPISSNTAPVVVHDVNKPNNADALVAPTSIESSMRGAVYDSKNFSGAEPIIITPRRIKYDDRPRVKTKQPTGVSERPQSEEPQSGKTQPEKPQSEEVQGGQSAAHSSAHRRSRRVASVRASRILEQLRIEATAQGELQPVIPDRPREQGFGLSDVQETVKPQPVGIVFERVAKHVERPSSNKKKKNKAEVKEDTPVVEDTITNLNVGSLDVVPLNIDGPAVPKLSFGLDRVLFNPGVYLLQDPHSRVYNFDPYLAKIMPVREFNFNLLKEYKTSSEDDLLSRIAQEQGKKYVGSTSSMTGVLAHFHFAISNFRPINTNMLSKKFKTEGTRFTEINRAPYGIFLRWKNGTYAIDADKEHDTPNVLMMLGKSMEKLLTLEKSDFERYRRGDDRGISNEERNAPEAFQFTKMGDLLMRSQLDAYDPRLPGSGTFDLKTRAVVSIRMDARNYEPMLGYELLSLQGDYESYEREYYDMIRSTMLKYSLQVRMGRMDGIFVAYHNVQRIFGFQYIPINELDRALHGQVDRCLGDQEFNLSLHLFNELLNAATKKFPEQSLRLLFEARGSESESCDLRAYAEPMEDKQIDEIQSKSKRSMAQYERDVLGMHKEVLPVDNSSTVNNSSDDESKPHFVKLEPDQKRPLWSAQVLLENSVNEEIVTRPENLKATDKWSVKYTVVESEDAQLGDTWSLYNNAVVKRKAALAAREADENMPEKKKNGYMESLIRLARKGRNHRAALDKAESDKEPIVWSSQ